MPIPPKPRPTPVSSLARHLQLADLRGLARLSTQATIGVTDITEGVHRSVLGTIGLAGSDAQRTGGLSGLVYRAVRGITRGVGRALDTTLAGMEPLLADVDRRPAEESVQRAAVLAALNGVLGDRLAADRSPFAFNMSLRHRGLPIELGKPLPVHAPRSRILLMVHGLCMNDLQWSRIGDDGQVHNHGEAAAAALGHTDLCLRYNSGRHVWQNGRDLAELLDRLLQHWPVPVEEVSVIAHSMGGLVIRSAVHQALQQQREWLQRLKQVIFLGTPHHGAPLERAGRGVDLLLAASPWTAPFSRLSGVRSAGITDLRDGRLIDEDPRQGRRTPLPLPGGIRWRAIAATLAERRSAIADRLTGDGLVPLDSALGRDADGAQQLSFADDSTWISPQTGHLALLSRPDITERIIDWLAESAAPPVPARTLPDIH
ncbi:esterase/lipase family protein [Piscinibacter sakaiensis]|uniref:esterase/lipase family protein n=1 Tax=Piscinibacter sakaiensis TaxID=1547922 RepID=UPI003AABFED5